MYVILKFIVIECHVLKVYGNLRIVDFNFDLIPLENDLLSLEIDYTFKEIFVD